MISQPAISELYTLLLVFLLLTGSSLQCGRGPGTRRRPGKMIPLVHKQAVPNVSENTIGASGKAEGRITRDSPAFKKLETNDNPNIIFSDEEGDGSDRLMTQRCKDKLNTLAVSVMNTWPNVKLRVTEAWDENGHHAKDSLHYEGRAVDITTSDRDRTKYGLLARLAVEAGFDWVYYESRGHIHCSVRLDGAVPVGGGCFTPTSTVVTDQGVKRMIDVAVGDNVLSVTSEGKVRFSEVITFLDRDEHRYGKFVTIQTEHQKSLTLTDKHLIHTSISKETSKEAYTAKYADQVQRGEYVLITDSANNIHPSQVLDISTDVKRGVVAPLTLDGTVVVDGVVASCYGVVNSETIAHTVFAPYRLYYRVSSFFSHRVIESSLNATETFYGIDRYAAMLYSVGQYILPRDMLSLV